MRVALYARYSSDHQRSASIPDQQRICREYAVRQGWAVVADYTDAAISGASLMRPGVQSLMRDAPAGTFDVVLAESLDRFSRDQEDTAGLFKRLTFAGVSPKAIGKTLNAEGIPGPRGVAWSPSTIHGHASRGTGILNNELYIGRLVWNR